MIINHNQIRKIINHYGHTTQFNKAVEELAELTRALVRDDRNNVIEEIADVYIMLEQLKIMGGISDDLINYVIDQKLNRTIERIDHEDQKVNHKCVISCRYFRNPGTGK
jgi:NTP pyrophosphatase (non-canonical NTP hydrolase)